MQIKLTKNGLNFQILLQVLVFGLATKYAHFKFNYFKKENYKQRIYQIWNQGGKISLPSEQEMPTS